MRISIEGRRGLRAIRPNPRHSLVQRNPTALAGVQSWRTLPLIRAVRRISLALPPKLDGSTRDRSHAFSRYLATWVRLETMSGGCMTQAAIGAAQSRLLLLPGRSTIAESTKRRPLNLYLDGWKSLAAQRESQLPP